MNSRWLAYALVLLGLMSLGTACKGDGGGNEGTFVEVLETSPVDGQTEVPVETRIGFRINAPIDPASLTTDTFFLTDGDGTIVPSSVAVRDEADTAELIPDEPLAVITGFTATVTTGLQSTGGATLEENFEWDFGTLDSEWGTSEWLEEISAGISDQQQIVVDGQSNALAVWEYTEASGSGIWANRYTRTGLWGQPELISAGDTATAPQVAADDAGSGFAVWEQREASADANIWTNRYVVDQGWGTPELLQEGEVTPARIPSIAADPMGNAIAIWAQRDMDTPSTEVVWARRFEPGAGWGAAESIDALPGGLAGTRTALGMDREGNAIAVWGRGPFVLWANRYTAGLGWGTAELIKPDTDTRARGQRLDVGPKGEAFVIWVQDDGVRDDIWGVRFSGSTWGTPERIDRHDDGDKSGPDIAVDGMGVAHAVWSQADADFENIYASRYTSGAWGTPVLIEPANEDPREDGDATSPRVGVNAAGNTFVVWRQIWDSWGSIWSNRIDPREDWDENRTELIETEGRPGKNPKIAVDENRHAHAIWLHSRDTGIDWVRTNRFE